MKKLKNKEQSSPPNSITERTIFFKMQNFPVFGFFRNSTSEKEKKCVQKLTKNTIFLHVYMRIA